MSAVSRIVILASLVGVFVVILGYRSERKPGNLAPVQLISAAGAWALVFANASALAIAIRDGSLILSGSVAVTLAIALFLFVRDEAVGSSSRETPEAVKLVVDDLKQLFDGAPRLGMDTLEAAVVTGRCPDIGVAVRQQGRLIVRVRSDIAQWLERHQHASGGTGTAVIASFARFTVLHELGHVLNGDHRTFRFVRAVLLAHVVWIAGTIAAAASFLVTRNATPLVVTSSILLLLAPQSRVARRFIAEREARGLAGAADAGACGRDAPARAARAVAFRAESDAAREADDRPEAQARPGTRGRGLLARLIALVWAEGDNIQGRVENMEEERFGSEPRPVLWAALMGMQCGLLAMSLAVAAMCAAVPWVGWRSDVADLAMLAITTWIVVPAATFCQMRIDPSRVSVRKVRRGESRIIVGVVFYLAFSASALALHRFQMRFAIASMPPDPVSSPCSCSLRCWSASAS
jgi:hypothetical protein